MTPARPFAIIGVLTIWPAVVVSVAFLLAWGKDALVQSRFRTTPRAKGLIDFLFPANILCPTAVTAIGVMISELPHTPVHSALVLFGCLCLFLFWPLYVGVAFLAPLADRHALWRWTRSCVPDDYHSVPAVVSRMFAVSAVVVGIELCWLFWLSLPNKMSMDF